MTIHARLAWPSAAQAAADLTAQRAAAGRKGGETTRDRYGPDYFSRIGKLGASKGGTTTRDRHGTAHYRRIGALNKGKTRAAHQNPQCGCAACARHSARIEAMD